VRKERRMKGSGSKGKGLMKEKDEGGSKRRKGKVRGGREKRGGVGEKREVEALDHGQFVSKFLLHFHGLYNCHHIS